MPEIEKQEAATFSEIGRTGLNRWGGQIQEEFLTELQGSRGVKVLREMSSNDPVIGAMLFAFEHLMRQVSWKIDPAGKENEHKERAESVWSALNDMSLSWTNTLSEIMSMLTFGWAWFEVIYKRRLGHNKDPAKKSKFDDGKIGWRKWAIRSQESLVEWKFDDEGGIRAMVQMPSPSFETITIPISKSLLFRTSIFKNNPEGISILRRAYRPWYFKKRIEEIEGIGVERDLAGLPILTPPAGFDIWNPKDAAAVAKRADAEKLVRSIRRDEQEGVVKPAGWTLELLSTGGRRQFDTTGIITRYDQRIAMSVLADFIMIGHERVGSFALAESKTHLFAVALNSFLDSITDVVNSFAIPTLLELNGQPLKALPKLVHGDIEVPNLAALGEYVSKLSMVGIDFNDESTTRYLRGVANLPIPEEEGLEKEENRLEREGMLLGLAELVKKQGFEIEQLKKIVEKNGQIALFNSI